MRRILVGAEEHRRRDLLGILPRRAKASDKAFETKSVRVDETLERGVAQRGAELLPAGFHLALTLGANTGPRSPGRVGGWSSSRGRETANHSDGGHESTRKSRLPLHASGLPQPGTP